MPSASRSLAALAGAVVFLAACGGDDHESSGSLADALAAGSTAAQTTPTEKPQAPKASPTAVATARSGRTPAPTVVRHGDDASPRRRIQDTLSMIRESREGRLEYRISGESSSEESNIFAGSMTGTWLMAAEGPNRNMTVAFDSDAGGMTMAMIRNAEGSFTCFAMKDESGEEAGLFSEKPSCIKDDDDDTGDDDGFEEFFDVSKLLFQLTSEGATLKPAPGRTVAGIAGDCYDVDDGDMKGTICVGKQRPILLVADGQNETGTFSFVLRSFSERAGPSDFTLPFDVADPFDFMNGEDDVMTAKD